MGHGLGAEFVVTILCGSCVIVVLSATRGHISSEDIATHASLVKSKTRFVPPGTPWPSSMAPPGVSATQNRSEMVRLCDAQRKIECALTVKINKTFTMVTTMFLSLLVTA